MIPFVLWQSITGTLYLWSERWMDFAYPTLRFVQEDSVRVPLGEQIQAALQTAGPAGHAAVAAGLPAIHAHHGAANTLGLTVQRILVPQERMGSPAMPEEPTRGITTPKQSARSTTVLLQRGDGLPFPVFVNPYTGAVLGQLRGTQWLPGLTRALHGGWPLGDAGSWLLELGDGWAIVMIATGLYLWWPRGRGIRALWPRIRAGSRVALRDLHSCIAVWFSLVFLFFLISALPWTAFWGGKLLTAVEARTGQTSPAGFSPGGATVTQIAAGAQTIEQVVSVARAAGVQGTLDIRLAPWPEAPVFIVNTNVFPSADRTVVADPRSGAIRGDYRNSDIPTIPRFVTLGVHVHQGDFGAANVWLNTAFAFSLVWLSVTGLLSWWNRRPRNKLGAPPKVSARIPLGLVAVATAACIVLPLLGASVLLGIACRKTLRLARRAVPLLQRAR